jgi:myo-inositol 2-dehydrogenase / D-chiro-inositol 1-dehydrogenase
MDLAPHDLDYVFNALSDTASSVYATGCSTDPVLQEKGVLDNALMVVNMKKGAVVTMQMSRSATFGYDQRCEFFGTSGSAAVTNPKEHDAVIRSIEGSKTARFSHSFPERFDVAFKKELETFKGVILGKGTWPVSEEECKVVQSVADAARRSYEEGRVVNIE